MQVIKKSQYEHTDGQEVADKILNEDAQNDVNKSEETSKSNVTTPYLNDASNAKNRKSAQIINKTTQANEKHPQAGKSKESEDSINKECVPLSKDSKNVSSCVIEVKVVWFNFAAPPRTPITRKIDYTR